MEMSKKLEKMRWRAEDRIYRKDEWVRQDTDELLGLEQKLNEMDGIQAGQNGISSV